jgi:hypothetical protein
MDKSVQAASDARVRETQTHQAATPAEPQAASEELVVPVMQQILENPFLLLFLGVAIPTVIYIVWGVMEIAGIPIAK